jgi:hypothetical protein
LEGKARPILILVTNGPDSTSPNDFNIQGILETAQRNAVVIYPMGFSAAKKVELQSFADNTRGKLFYLGSASSPDSSVFQGTFTDLYNSLVDNRLQYSLRIQALAPRDGREHQIMIEASHIGLTASDTATFTAPPPPGIGISLPSLPEGAEIGGIVKFQPDFDSVYPLQRLEVLIDGQPLAPPVLNPPFEVEWDASQTDPKAYQFTFTATDTQGNIGSKDINYTVQPAVRVQFITPQDTDTVSGAVPIEATIKMFTAVANAELFIDGKKVDQQTSKDYRYEWSAYNIDNLVHEIRLVATDMNNLSGEQTVKVLVGAAGATGTVGGGQAGGSAGALAIPMAVGLAAAVVLITLAMRTRRKTHSVSADRVYVDPSLPNQNLGSSIDPQAGARLYEQHGVNPGQSWNLSFTEEIRLGRKREENDIPLLGASASRRHAMLHYSQGNFILYNLKPENPVLVNGQLIAQQRTLSPGDSIQLGESVFEFQA